VTPQTVAHGGQGTPVTATANQHYVFDKWSDGTGSALFPTRQEFNVTSNLTVTAQFLSTDVQLGYAPSTGGVINDLDPGTTQYYSVHYGEDGPEVTANPLPNYRFVKWSDDVMTATRQDLDNIDDLYVVAQFETSDITLRYLAGTGGSISGDAVQTVHLGDDGTEVTAVADEHYRFVKWSDNVMTASRRDLDNTEDLTVTATFELIYHELTYLAGAGGSVEGDTEQTVVDGGDGTLVTARPDEPDETHIYGFEFVEWSDGVLAPARRELDVRADLTVTAIFREYSPIPGYKRRAFNGWVAYKFNKSTMCRGWHIGPWFTWFYNGETGEGGMYGPMHIQHWHLMNDPNGPTPEEMEHPDE
jgi:hypothetical protein